MQSTSKSGRIQLLGSNKGKITNLLTSKTISLKVRRTIENKLLDFETEVIERCCKLDRNAEK